MEWFFRPRLPSRLRFSSSSTAEEVTLGIDASDLTAIVTGANSGLGAETARVLALRGVRLVLAVRDISSGLAVKDRILHETNAARVHVLPLDLSSMASVRKFVDEFKTLDLPLNILINNAGILACPYGLSSDGIELHFAINHIGHFLLTKLLLGEMKKSAEESGIEGRIVIVSSVAHRFPYPGGIRFEDLNDRSRSNRVISELLELCFKFMAFLTDWKSDRYVSWLAYGQSKLANVLHALELTRRLQDEGVNVTANSLHPGAVYTNIFRHAKLLRKLQSFTKFFWKTIPQGAATQCFVALHPSLKGVSGLYFKNCNESKPSAHARDLKLAKTLWDFSESLCE